MANAINKADFESVSGYLLSWFGRATRWLAAVNTSKNPSFAIFNFMRDVGFANLTHLMDNGLAYSGKFNLNVLNPEALEHLFTAYTGGVGRFFSDSYKTLENAANGRFESSTVPMLNRLVKQYDEDKAFLKDYYSLVDRIRDMELAREATKKAIIGRNGQRYDKALEEYRQLLSSDRYVAAMKAKAQLKSTMDRISKILARLDEEKDEAAVLELKAERTRLMKKAKGYLGEME